MAANTDGRFEGKVAFVTGAGSGIGRATALAFARAGASVAVAGIPEQDNLETVGMIEKIGGRVIAITCDVSRPEDAQRALRQTIETFGRLDVAFNNAGVEQPGAAMDTISDDEWARLIDVNLGGVFLCMKAQIPLLRQQGGDAIVNTSSGARVKGFKGQAAYAAAKWRIIGLSTSVALDYAAEGIRINVVAPGVIDTEMMDRFSGGTPVGDRSGAGRPDGPAGGDRRRGAVPVLGRSVLHHRGRAGRRRRPNGVARPDPQLRTRSGRAVSTLAWESRIRARPGHPASVDTVRRSWLVPPA